MEKLNKNGILVIHRHKNEKDSLPKTFKTKSLFDLFLSKNILIPSITLSGELSPPIASIAIEIFFDINCD